MKVIIAILVLASVLVAGCVGQSPTTQQPPPVTGPAVREFNVTIFHTGYSPSSFTVNKGDTVRFRVLTSPGTIEHMHGITIDAYNINEDALSVTEPKVIEFVADKSGTFSVYCKTCWDGIFGRGHPDIRTSLTVVG